MILQTELVLPAYRKGFHLITNLINNALSDLPEIGILNIFIQHTSAGLTINENADPSVRVDLNSFFEQLVPENIEYFTHTIEGADDMPAHIKASIFGNSLNIPIQNHSLALGIWQGIYLCEFRNHGGQRKLILTVSS